MKIHTGAEVWLQSLIIFVVRWKLKVIIKPGPLHPGELFRFPFIWRPLRPIFCPCQVSKPGRKIP